MHTIKLQVQDTMYEHIMFLLKNLNSKELKIIEDKTIESISIESDIAEIKAFSNHSANLIDDWKDDAEDAIWK
jgi:hypothetical protein